MPELVFGIILAAVVLALIVGLVMMRGRSTSDTMFTPLDSSGPNTPAPTPAAPYVMASGLTDMTASGFHLTIQDVFMIKGRGLVVTGKVDSGSLQVGQRIQISSPDGSQHYDSQVKGLEAFRKQISLAQTGDNVGILLGGLTKDQIKSGMVITQHN